MNELVTVDRLRSDEERFIRSIIESNGAGLPATIEEIIPILAFSKAKMEAYKALSDAVKKVGQQEHLNAEALASGQRWGIVHLYGQKRLGEITREMPKARAGKGERGRENVITGSVITKEHRLNEAGLTSKGHAISDAERIAANPEVLDRVVERAKDRGEIPTKTEVLREIKFDAVKKRGEQPREFPDINRVALDVHGKLVDCRNKLMKLYEHRESLDGDLTKSIESVVDEIASIVFEEV